MTLAEPRLPASAGTSVTLERLRARRADGKTLRLALVLAVAVHGLAFLVPLPRATITPPERTVQQGPEITETILEPPELPPQPIRTVVAGERRRLLPVPDLPDDYVEPAHEPVDVTAVDADSLGEAPVFLPAPVPPAPAGPMDETTQGLVLPAKLPGAAKPVYPEMARTVRLQGTVVLRAIIDRTGNVTSIRVIREPGVNAGFVEAAKAAVSQWRYEPGRYGGEPVAVSMTVVVEFTLR
jgi:protein TonB